MSNHHDLLRGSRWHLARPRSRALWTSASDREVEQLLTDTRLRYDLEQVLRRAAAAVDDIDALLLFDAQSVDLVAVVALARGGERCTWEWIAHSARQSQPSAR